MIALLAFIFPTDFFFHLYIYSACISLISMWNSFCHILFCSCSDFTPSQGNTPDHQTNASITPKLDTHFFLDKYPDSKSQPSPTGRKKLGDLLQETPQGELIVRTATAVTDGEVKVGKIVDDHPPQSSNGSPCHSEDSSVIKGTPSRDRKSRKSRTWKANHCCLPSLQSFGFDEKKQCSASWSAAFSD